MADVVRLEQPKSHQRDPDGFVLTATVEDILRSLALIRSIDGPR